MIKNKKTKNKNLLSQRIQTEMTNRIKFKGDLLVKLKEK